MGSRGWSLRELFGLAIASAVLAAPLGALASAELAEHWARAGGSTAESLTIAVAWAVIFAFGADAARRVMSQEASGGPNGSSPM